MCVLNNHRTLPHHQSWKFRQLELFNPLADSEEVLEYHLKMLTMLIPRATPTPPTHTHTMALPDLSANDRQEAKVGRMKHQPHCQGCSDPYLEPKTSACLPLPLLYKAPSFKVSFLNPVAFLMTQIRQAEILSSTKLIGTLS